MNKASHSDSTVPKSELETIISDNLSGSNELLMKLNDYFSRNYRNIDFTNELFEYLENSFRSFASITNYLSQLKLIVSQKDKNKLVTFLNTFNQNKNNSYKLIYSKLKTHLKENISLITISNSKTVFEIIKLIKAEFKIEKIVVCESRPQFEGRILAEKIAGIGLNVNLITEANIPEYTNICDIAIVGADRLLANGNVINKTGSKSLGIICKYYNKPYIVISDSSKMSSDSEFYEDEKPAKEIFEKNKRYITIKNHYFEEVDKSLITEIITDL